MSRPALRITWLLPCWGLMCAVLQPVDGAARWPQFRGENCSGVAEGDRPPVEFGPAKKLLWKTSLPRGVSSPCVWDDRIFVTAFDKGKLETICLRRADGQILWRQQAPAEKIERVSGHNSPAAATPATDGRLVYVYFGASCGLVAYDFDGRQQWHKPLPIYNVRHGSATSPILAGGRLVVNGDQEDGRSFLIAVEPWTGRTLWQTPRPMYLSSQTTPVYWKRGDVEEVIVAGCVRLTAYDLKDGAERWSCRGLEAISIANSPVVGDNMLYAMSESMGEDRLPTFESLLAQYDRNKDSRISPAESPRIVRDIFSVLDVNKDGNIAAEEYDERMKILGQADHGLLAVRAPDRTGDVTDTHIVWRQKKGISEVSSPLYYRGRVFIIKDGGLASCFEARTGRPLYQLERIGADGRYYASPVAADGRIYVASMSGVVTVIAADDELKVLARNDLGEAMPATPAIADNKLYVRTTSALWAFGD